MQKTFMQRTEDVVRIWHLVDAKGRVLGQVATEVATKLMGKNKATFTPHTDGGDFVIVINAAEVVVTGNKAKTKMYSRHSGFPGGYKEISFEELIATQPEKVIVHAVNNMLSNNKLRDRRLARLKVYAGAEHPHAAQLAHAVTSK
jgi:large subunit ribosomal protein L13